jgi:anti-sigma B factor antagonist
MATIKKQVQKLRVENDMTIYTASEMKTKLVDALAQGAEIEMDLSHVAEMDTAGLQLLIAGKRECMAHGGNLKLTGHSPAVLEVLDMCGMIRHFGDPVVISSQAN